jgi:predicted DsbA family dithiol-disulfide isomerase
MSKLSPAAQREFKSVLGDEFCHCGCPHSIGSCLKEHPSCKHANRMAAIAASEADTGAPSVEISVSLSKYYLSFRERRRSFRADARLCQGAQDAKVTLMEFSDFECPYCAAARSTLEEFARQNASTVRFCFAPFPLPIHPHALPAARLALLARDRGKFWQMHDLLFENQARLNDQVLRELGQKVGLSDKEISSALESSAYRDELKASEEAGRGAGVDATPTVYINGRKLTLSLKANTLKQTVEDELEWTAQKNAWAAD